MKTLLEKQKRPTIRLRECDYSQEGVFYYHWYPKPRKSFRENCKRGNILNAVGKVVKKVREELPKYYPGVKIDVFVVMPNHFYG